MIVSDSFREGAKAAVPIWIAFTVSSFALGVAAKAHGLHWGEIVLMSALVYAGPAQFAAVGPLGAGSSALQVLLATFLINLRLLPMGAALAPYFRKVKRTRLLYAAHFVSASSFVVPYLRFQREAKGSGLDGGGEKNLSYFFGVALSSYPIWVAGTGVGYWAALHVPAGFDEGMRFVLPGYFASLLATEAQDWAVRLVCVASLFFALIGALWNPDWGWIVTALIIATIGWGGGEWMRRA